jgi:hypothetical protein
MKAALQFTASLLIFLAASIPGIAQHLTVHEWGTFTTMQGSDGTTLSGLYLEEESLPGFVYHHEGFAPDSLVLLKGLYKPVLQATVKMETPVLYFYAQQGMSDVTVHVDFPPGTISQWYPQRSDGETGNLQESIDLGKAYNGWIEWKADVLAPGTKIGLSAPEDQATHTWVAPRATDANLVQTHKGEVEHFLFYRGVANFGVPLHTAFNTAGELVLTNTGDEAIPYLLIYDKATDTPFDIWWTGPLAAGESRVIARPSDPITEEMRKMYMAEFEQQLTAAGLYQKESAAMLNTWNQSYFNSSGLRVFWIVPRGFTDRILPIRIKPEPNELERVLVGRSEVMTPALEKEIAADYSSGNRGKWEKDRYLLAYDERMKQLQEQIASTPSGLRTNEMLHAAFTTQGMLEITGRFESAGMVKIAMSNLLGQPLIARSEESRNGILQSQFNANELPAGVYFLTVQIGDRQWVRKMVKE